MRSSAWIIALSIFLLPLAAKAECTLTSSGETRPTGTIIHNVDHNVVQKCGSDGNWRAMTPSIVNPCTGTPSGPSIGDTCSDGSIYAGLSPDGNVAMYINDANTTFRTHSWDDGTANNLDTAMDNCTDGPPGSAATCQTGEANTAFLVGLSGSGSPAPYIAAEYCASLTAHGHSDWYLPAQDELDSFKSLLPVETVYWSSSELDAGNAVFIDTCAAYGSGSLQCWLLGYGTFGKSNDEPVIRCARK